MSQALDTASASAPISTHKSDHKASKASEDNGQDTGQAIALVPGTDIFAIVGSEAWHMLQLPLDQRPTETFTVDGIEASYPVQIYAGQVATDYEARVVFTHLAAQFRNNMNANAVARSKRFDAAKTDKERADNQPWTAVDYQTAWLTFRPAVGGTPRKSAIEAAREAAAWDVFLAKVDRHNAAIATGGKPEFRGAYLNQEFVVPTSVKGAPEWRKEMTEKVLNTASYASAIEVRLAEILAEKAANKGKKEIKVSVNSISTSDLI